MWPDRQRALHAWHSVLAPSGPGLLLLVSTAFALHQLQLQVPPSQNLLCPPTATTDSNTFEHWSHSYFPSAFFSTAFVWPERKRLPHVAHSVLEPFGPGALPVVPNSSTLPHSQFHVPPVHPRRWDPRPRIVSNLAPHASHKKFPSASLFGGPV